MPCIVQHLVADASVMEVKTAMEAETTEMTITNKKKRKMIAAEMAGVSAVPLWHSIAPVNQALIKILLHR